MPERAATILQLNFFVKGKMSVILHYIIESSTLDVVQTDIVVHFGSVNANILFCFLRLTLRLSKQIILRTI